MNTDRSIRFHFDFISHNAYLAWTQIEGLAARFNRRVEPVPVLFAELLKRYGQQGPAEVPPKSAWMLRNVLRKAKSLGVPISPPASHPFNPLLALRVSSLDMEDAIRERLVSGLFSAVWAEGRSVSDPEEVVRICHAAGLEGRDVLREASEDQIKARLRDATEKALQAGVFGVPTMIVDGELFWGYDDFPNLTAFLSGKDVLNETSIREWSKVRPSASRKA